MDTRYQIECVESEMSNLALLAEYGKAAWAEDNAVAAQMLVELESELAAATSRLVELETQRAAKEERIEKQLGLMEKDLFNYARNSGQTLVAIRALEQRARELLEGLKELGVEDVDLERFQAEMNLIW